MTSPSLMPRLAGLFFLHAFAPGLWMVSLGNVLAGKGWSAVVPWAYALGPITALVSPLWVGALADQKMDARRLLRWLCWASALFLFLGFTALDKDWGKGWFLFWHGLHVLCFTPSWALVSTIVFANIPDPARQFPLLRMWATISWIVAGLAVSHWLKADTSPIGGKFAAGFLALSATYTFLLPPTPPPAAGESRARGWRSALGLDALGMFRTGDFRVFLITTGLLAVPLAAFLPFAPRQLTEMGLANPTAWMTLGQVAETVSMIMLGWMVLRWKVKWVMVFGLVFATLRYILLAIGAATGWLGWIFPGLAMHGLIFTLYFVTSQIFLEMRVPTMVRARAQALLTTVNGGIGSLIGTLGCGWWHGICGVLPVAPMTRWAIFWGVLALLPAAALWIFLRNYKGREDPTTGSTDANWEENGTTESRESIDSEKRVTP